MNVVPVLLAIVAIVGLCISIAAQSWGLAAFWLIVLPLHLNNVRLMVNNARIARNNRRIRQEADDLRHRQAFESHRAVVDRCISTSTRLCALFERMNAERMEIAARIDREFQEQQASLVRPILRVEHPAAIVALVPPLALVRQRRCHPSINQLAPGTLSRWTKYRQSLLIGRVPPRRSLVIALLAAPLAHVPSGRRKVHSPRL